MRAVVTRLVIISIGLIVVHLAYGAEFMSYFWDTTAIVQHCRDYGHLKGVEILSAASVDAVVKEFLSELRATRTEGRCIVTRKHNAKTPTWDRKAPALIVEPAIWYFDPDSRIWEMNSTWWQAPICDHFAAGMPKENNTTRRTMADFVFEDYKFPNVQSRPPTFGWHGLFR